MNKVLSCIARLLGHMKNLHGKFIRVKVRKNAIVKLNNVQCKIEV